MKLSSLVLNNPLDQGSPKPFLSQSCHSFPAQTHKQYLSLFISRIEVEEPSGFSRLVPLEVRMISVVGLDDSPTGGFHIVQRMGSGIRARSFHLHVSRLEGFVVCPQA